MKRAEENNDERPSTQGADSQTQDRELSPSQSKRAKASSNPRQQNVMLLVNAIRTTALHATESFTLPTAAPSENPPDAAAEGQTPGAGPGPTPGARSTAATPAPATRGATPVGNKRAGSPLDREPTKGQPGAGKKKKRRKSTILSRTSARNSTNIMCRDRNLEQCNIMILPSSTLVVLLASERQCAYTQPLDPTGRADRQTFCQGHLLCCYPLSTWQPVDRVSLTRLGGGSYLLRVGPGASSAIHPVSLSYKPRNHTQHFDI